MFKGYSVALPFNYSKEDGPYALNKTMIDVIKQNLKTLILTDKGERIMLPEFGAGIRRYLFENSNQTTKYEIQSQITLQVKRYMPFINIESVDVFEDPNNLNKIIVQIKFLVPSLNIRDLLTLGG